MFFILKWMMIQFAVVAKMMIFVFNRVENIVEIG